MKWSDIIRETYEPPCLIDEAFAHSFMTFRKTQCDVFKNPSVKEYREALVKNDDVRAFIVGQEVLIWNTFSALHQMVRDEMHLSNDAISIVIYGVPRQSCAIVVTDNNRSGPWFHNAAVADVISNNPYLKRTFPEIDISYFDEDIVGDWVTMDDEDR
jgi:hypothetical protein